MNGPIGYSELDHGLDDDDTLSEENFEDTGMFEGDLRNLTVEEMEEMGIFDEQHSVLIASKAASSMLK